MLIRIDIQFRSVMGKRKDHLDNIFQHHPDGTKMTHAVQRVYTATSPDSPLACLALCIVHVMRPPRLRRAGGRGGGAASGYYLPRR